MVSNETYLKTALKASEKSSEILKSYFGQKINIEKKGFSDIVTSADKESENKIIEIIYKNFPTHSILAEESGSKKGNSDYKWIIDPLDGTTNFASRLPLFSVSIALYKGKAPILGVVKNPVTNQTYTAVASKGAFLNNEKISVTKKEKIEDCLIVTGFPYNFKEIKKELSKRFFDVLDKTRGIRRLGSAAIDLCLVASGIFDGFFEQNLKPWDTAAGIIIAREAGAKITDFSGSEYNPFMGQLLATNNLIHKNMISILE